MQYVMCCTKGRPGLVGRRVNVLVPNNHRPNQIVGNKSSKVPNSRTIPHCSHPFGGFVCLDENN